MGQRWENESHFINMGHTHQNCCTWNYESHWAKWVSSGQMGQIWENESHFINMGQTYQNCPTLKHESHWAKWITFGQMGVRDDVIV